MVHYGKGLISVFQGFFASISECFVSAGGGRGGLALGLHSMEFRYYPDVS